MAKRVGVVGLGIMGGAFARNLIAAGWSVTGFDIDAARCRTMSRAGIKVAPDVGALAAETPTIITSLPNPDALTATVHALVRARVPSRVIVEASTFALDDKQTAERELRKAGHIMLDCPVSGTGEQAKTKDLAIYASGDRKSIRQLLPLFKAFARAVHDLGRFGNGSRMKYVANLLVAINNVASAEAMVLGLKAGLDPRTIFDMVRIGAGTSRVFELRGPMMVKGRYEPASMKVSVWQKDMAVIGDFARHLGCPTPLFDATVPIYNSAIDAGQEEHDTAAVCAVLEQMAGVKRPRRRAGRD
jgi:3-hydroxyisobutyrate dehydrogenase-like beta-hydroxyacid dehydrogenase